MHDQLEWMRASLDGLSFDGSTVLEIKWPHEWARPDRRSTGKRASAILGTTAARARGLTGGRGPLLVVRWQGGKPGQGTPRPRIPEAAVGCRGRVLAAGQGKRLARAGGRRTRLKRRSEMAPRRAPLSRSESTAGDSSCGRAQATRDAREHGNSAQDLWLRSRALEKLSKGNCRLRRNPGAAWCQSGTLPQAAGLGRQDQLS